MGATLVSKVLTYWTHVSDRAFRVLVRMAVTALDKPTDDTPAATYFAGRELLAMSLRGDGGSERSKYRIVARVISELIEVGAIERIDGGRTGHNAVYRLTLGEPKSVEKAPDQGGQFSHPQGGQIGHPKDGQFSPARVANLATPRKQEEPLEELQEEKGGSSTTASHPLRATALPTLKNCPDHLISLKPRTDGTQACPFCRRGVPPFEPTLATVTSIDSRRIS